MAKRLPWPLPALLSWGAAWVLFGWLQDDGSGPVPALATATLLGVVCSLLGNSWWRRLMIGAGFPLSLAASGLLAVPPWVWLVPLVLVLLVYPFNAWRDAPLFPTPVDALLELTRLAPLQAGALVLDAGCGLGHGLIALRKAYPQALFYGVEWSWPLRWLCALRCPWAHIERRDLWRHDWSRYDLVYLFQRPESMPGAVHKARAELKPGAWLVSLEFEATELQPSAHYPAPGGKMVWLYRAPFGSPSGD